MADTLGFRKRPNDDGAWQRGRAKEFERGEELYGLSRCLEEFGAGEVSREALEELRRLGPRGD